MYACVIAAGLRTKPRPAADRDKSALYQYGKRAGNDACDSLALAGRSSRLYNGGSRDG
jgi:hypothetical protein